MTEQNTMEIKEKVFNLAEELGEDYASMLKEDFYLW